MNVSHSIPATVCSISFSFLSSENVRRISVKQIVNHVLLDDLNRPNIGGLYDPALGPSDKQDMCVSDPFKLHSELTSSQLRDLSTIVLYMPRTLRSHRTPCPCLSSTLYGENVRPPPRYMPVLPPLQG